MLIWDARQSAVSLVAALLLCALLWLLVYEAGLPAVHWLWPPLVAGGFYYGMMRRLLRRRRLLRQPFPEAWRALLRERVDYYTSLPPDEQAAFEMDVQLFLAEHRVTGVGVEVTDLLRLLVASSAVMLTFGWPDWEYDNVPEVLIYPRSFSEEYDTSCPGKRRPLSGMVVPQGAVILSAPDLIESFAGEDFYHVGVHEFAHLLDMEGWESDGVPKNLHPRLRKKWVSVLRNELDRARRGESLLRDYAGENLAECFAVAAECFFKTPLDLRDYDPLLYEMLASYFNQDVAE